MMLKDLLPTKWFSSEKKVPVQQETADPVYTLQRNMDRVFDDFFHNFGMTRFGEFGAPFQPRVDVEEADDKYTVSAELPGLSENEVEVNLTKNVLTLRGEKKHEHEQKTGNYYYTERSYGTFYREIPFDVEVEADQVAATFKNGVLTVTLPKSAKAHQARKRIAVKTN